MTFDDIYKIVEESSHETAFNRGEAEALYKYISKLPTGAKIVEIGVEFGRSTSIIACLAKERGLNFLAVDNWVGEYSVAARKHILSQMHKYSWNFGLIPLSSEAAHAYVLGHGETEIDFVHIDGDHTYGPVLLDCTLWLPLVKSGGYAAFDDYGHDSLPEVYAAVCDYMEQHPEWKFVGKYGDKLGVYKKI